MLSARLLGNRDGDSLGWRVSGCGLAREVRILCVPVVWWRGFRSGLARVIRKTREYAKNGVGKIEKRLRAYPCRSERHWESIDFPSFSEKIIATGIGS
jgi:hypothetical protein